MAHTPNEPAGHELMPVSDEVTATVVYTNEGPVAHFLSETTGQRIRVPVHMLPHLSALGLTIWQDHEHDGTIGPCCAYDDCDCDDEDDE